MGGLLAGAGEARTAEPKPAALSVPNVLFVMTDQQRFDTIAALGNKHIYTPNLDRLVRRGITFTNAYSHARSACRPATPSAPAASRPPPAFSATSLIAAGGRAGRPRWKGAAGPYLARTMKGLGYRTFGIGKFHTSPGTRTLASKSTCYSEEMYGTPEIAGAMHYAAWIAREHPAFDFIEALMGERTEMYYMPQISPLPAELTVERWAADRAVEQIQPQRSAALLRLCFLHRAASALCPADPLQPHVRSRSHAESGLRRARDRSHGRTDSR